MMLGVALLVFAAASVESARLFLRPPVAGSAIPDRMAEASFMLIAGVLTALTITFLAQMLRNETFSIDRKWGSLGNSADGWSCTAPVATLSGIMITLVGIAILCVSLTLISKGQQDPYANKSGNSATVPPGNSNPPIPGTTNPNAVNRP